MNLKKLFRSASLLCVASATAASSFAISFVVSDGLLDVGVTISDVGTNTVQVDLQTNANGNGVLADLRGFWAAIDPYVPVTILGTDITYIETGDGTVGQALDGGSGNNININGEVDLAVWDLGVIFGTSGMGTDDIQSTSFTITGAGLLASYFTDVAIRATSVGVEGSRGESSKIYGEVPPSTEVPDNGATYALLGLAVSSLLIGRRYLAK